ncbi:MAG: glycosyltransferase [Candidatus Aminicenantes bacterium]|nr:MAG: glycosyltransferase [Candidatus Aminicenantes bacterium]
MKVLFINHKDIEGGGAIAAYRLSKGLEAFHHTENHVVVKEKRSGDANVFATIDNQSETLNEVKVFFEFMVDRMLSRLGFQYYYFPFSTRFILKKARDLQPDIISLHIIHGGYFKTSLIKKLSKVAPIVWTMHDMWGFTANAAHTFGDESWKQLKSGKGEKTIYPHVGINRGKALLKRKRRIYKKSDLHVVTPSQWLYHLAKQSPVFENKPLHRIAHGLDLEIFKPKNKTACRKVLGLPENAKAIMFSSADDLGKSPWKGGQLLVDILNTIDSKTPYPIEILVLGKGELKVLQHMNHLNVHRIRYIDSEQLMTVLLSAADLYVYPTRADNLPLVLMESIACGTPCITFDVGGCGDIIHDDVCGYLIKPFDVETFADKTLEILNNKEKLRTLSETSRKFAEEHFSLEDMADAYYQLFQKILNSRSRS